MTIEKNMKNEHYIMSPELFECLSEVIGFNTLNGNTYMEYITIVRPEIHPNIKKEILQCHFHEDALDILQRNGIEYTHNYSFL